MFDISLKCQWEVGCGAGGLKVGPVIKFIRSDRLPMRERYLLLWTKTHCCGIIITASWAQWGLLALLRTFAFSLRVRQLLTTWDQNHWTLSYLNWNWFPFLQEFWLWTFSGGAVLMSEPSLIPRGKKISTRRGKIYYYQNTLSPTHWNIS